MEIEITDSRFSLLLYTPLNNKVLCGTAGGKQALTGLWGLCGLGIKQALALAGQRLCVGSVGYCWRDLKCPYNDFLVMYCGRV
jgi:hypothetical protein